MNGKKIAEEIIILRGKKNWTQQELADQVSTSLRTVVAWESGTSLPRKTTQVQLARAFGLKDNYFFELTREEEELDGRSKADRFMEKFEQMIEADKISAFSTEQKSQLMDTVSSIVYDALDVQK